MLEIIVASFVENGVSITGSDRPSSIKSGRYKPPDLLDISPAVDRPISPTETHNSHNGISTGSYKSKII